MPIIRAIKSSGNFSIIHKEFLQDNSLSAKAKGVMAYMLSLPENSKITIDELTKHFKDGRDGIRTAIKELEERGYLTKKKIKDNKGRFTGVQYQITKI